MAGNFVDSLVIGIGLDTSQIAEGVQQVGAQLDSGLSAAAQSAASKMSPLGEALKNLATQAEGIAKPAEETLQALHGLGLKAASEYQEQIDAIKAGLAQIQNDPALSDSDKASAMEAASAKIDELKAKMEGLKEPASEAMQVLKDLGIRTTEELQKSLDTLKAKLAAVQNDSTLTARDKMAAMKELQTQIERTEMELKRGLPQAAAQGFAGAEAAANKFKGFMSSLWAQISGPLMGAFAIGGTISSYISNATAAGELADKLKVDIEEIQIWSGAMDRAGGSASALQGTIEKLTKSGKDNGDVFGTLLDLAEQAETMSKEAFVAKAKELEIDEKTIDVLQRGRKALEEHLKTQKELGAYRKEDAENAKKFKQALSDLLAAWDGLTAFLGRFATPVMEWAAKVLKDVVVFLRNHAPMTAAALAMIGAAIAYKLLPPLNKLPAALSKVWAGFLRFAPFVVVIGALALLFDDLWGYMHGEDAEFSEFWAILGTGPELLEKWERGWKSFKETATDALNGTRDLVRNLNESMEKHGAWDGLAEQFKGNIELIKGVAKGDGKLIAEGLWDSIVGTFKLLSGMSTVLGEAVVGAVKKAFSLLPSNVTLDDLEKKLEQELSNFFKSLNIPSLDEISKAFDKLIEDIKAKIKKWWDGLFSDLGTPKMPVLDKAGDLAGGAVNLVKGGIGKVGDFFSDMFKDAQPATEEAGGKVESGMAKTAQTVKQGFNTAWNATKDYAVTQFQGAAVTIQGIFAGVVSGIETQVGNLVLGAQKMAGGPSMVPAFAGVRAQQAGGRGGNTTINQNNRINVDARGGDPAKVQRGVERGIDPSRVTRASQSGTVPKG